MYLTYFFRPGEELAASGFVAVIFYLFVDINFGIHRTFKKKTGLYYWCLLLGILGCLIDNIAVVLRFFVHNPEPLWPLYTLFILLGWTMYAPAQLLVLYSRLHLVNRNRKLQRWMLIMIVVVASLMIIPTWPLAWQAYNPYNLHLSALYSPRDAINERCTQLGYTFAESILGGIYIWSLTKLLNLKSSVRQRRVMIDLIYVNVIAVSLDILTVVLVYLNQTGISHPIQTFSYTLKFKLEFMVLNQLMAVAARGIRRESFAERRYHHHHPSASVGKNGSPAVVSSTASTWGLDSSQEPTNDDPAMELQIPSRTLSNARGTASKDSGSHSTHAHADGGRWRMNAKVKKHGAGNRHGEEEDDDDEDEEIGVHMWERRGKLVMEVPWFKTDDHA